MSATSQYRDLLIQYLPQPIRTDRDYRRAMAQLEELMAPRPGAARSRLIEMLSTLIADYESKELPAPRLAPPELLAHLLSVKGAKCADVTKATGISPATLSSVLAGRRGVSKANARRLASYFNVSSATFLEEDTKILVPANGSKGLKTAKH